jgi:ketosteroid isomerase-like protein
MSQANVELVQAILERWSRRESTADLIADDLEYVNPPYAVESGTRRGRDALGGVLDVYPDFHFEPERYVDAGDEVVVIGVARGTSASGLEASWRQAHVWTIRAGKAVRFRWFLDPADALAAAGVEG